LKIYLTIATNQKLHGAETRRSESPGDRAIRPGMQDKTGFKKRKIRNVMCSGSGGENQEIDSEPRR